MGQKGTKESLFLKYEFNDQEKLSMASTLAANHNELDDIVAEEEVFKSQIKQRKSALAQSVQALSRSISTGFEMRNTLCIVIYDKPNIGEVTYVREDTGEIARIRPMTEQERQMDLPLGGDSISSLIDSAKNVEDFFAKPEAEEAPAQENADDLQEGEEYDPFTDPDPAASKDAIKADNDAAFEGEPPADEHKKRGRPAKQPKGFSGPTNPSSIADF